MTSSSASSSGLMVFESLASETFTQRELKRHRSLELARRVLDLWSAFEEHTHAATAPPSEHRRYCRSVSPWASPLIVGWSESWEACVFTSVSCSVRSPRLRTACGAFSVLRADEAICRLSCQPTRSSWKTHHTHTRLSFTCLDVYNYDTTSQVIKTET